MKYKETDTRGSLVAWGVGFNYEYNPDDTSLNILNARVNRPLLNIKCDRDLSQDPLAFMHDIDKATQIYAMMFSNNDTVDLAELFEEQKLLSLLENSVRLARYSYDLQHLNFKSFAAMFCQDFHLKGIRIKQIGKHRSSSEFYVAKLKTQQNNSAKVIDDTLPGILRRLSEKTARDLIAEEYWSVNQSSAYDLLAVSSNLATISRILDQRFSPHKRIARYSQIKTEELMRAKSNKTQQIQ